MRKHTGEKPYKCTYCARTFARIETCREHENLHTKEKPYVCELCGAAFSNSGNFSKHKKSHATTNGKETSSKKLNKLKDIDLGEDNHSIDLHIVNASAIRTNAVTDEIIKSPTRTTIDLINNQHQLDPNTIVEGHKNLIVEGDDELINLPQLLKDVNTQQILLDAGTTGESDDNSNKSIQVAFNNMLEPLIEPTASSRTSITKTGHRLVDKTQINNEDNMDDNDEFTTFETLKLPSYQFPSSLYTSSLPTVPPALPPPHTQSQQQQHQTPVTSYLLTDLNFPQSSLSMNSNQTFMMMDYYQRADSTFSFASDGSLVVQQNTFAHHFPHLQQSLFFETSVWWSGITL